ncbi:MAG: cysteine hydrolase family protein [Clostridiaceae bacterium]|nr:cysteine hydrolase family protein [Clostridiaceae bacterium]
MKRALLVIDVQNEYFTGKLPATYPQDSFTNILKAMDAANQNSIETVIIQHTAPQKDSETFARGSHGWELHAKIKRAKFSCQIEKSLPGSFTNTNLEQWLKDREIDTITICGYMTQMCCDTTARQGLHLGFSVEFLSDATGTLDISNYAGKITAEELHKAILITQAMRFSRVLPTSEWIDILSK